MRVKQSEMLASLVSILHRINTTPALRATPPQLKRGVFSISQFLHRPRPHGRKDEIGFQTDLHPESHVNFRHEFEQRIDKTCFERAIAADLLVGFVFGIRAESGYAGRRSGRSSVLFVFVHRSESGLTCNSLDGTPEVPGHRSWRLLEYSARSFSSRMSGPGHFVILETWKTSAAFDARSADRKQLTDAVQSMRTSDWDTRPYKTLSVAQDVKESDDGAVAVITHVDVSPDPAVAPLLVVLTEASRRETGNLRFDVMQHTMRANHFQVIEVWKNRKALDDHAAADHTKKYRNDLQRFLGSPLDERIFKAVR
jgi:quinol monooxygenase YgiN